MYSKNVYIGTSGIVLPVTKINFPEAFKSASRLHFYSSLFNTLEINSSFYKVPLPTTFAKWAADVPDNFKFTVKLWRDITHAKKLACDLDDIDKFMQAADCLGNKRGALLIQFPASINLPYWPALEKIFERLAALNAFSFWNVAVEVRHTSWYCEFFYRLLAQYKVELVVHDMPGSPTPLDLPQNDFAYFRFHGPTGKYNESYSAHALQGYADLIRPLCKQNKPVYVYFNNTMGDALRNAQSLQKLLQGKSEAA